MRLLSASQERRLFLNGLFNSLRAARTGSRKDFRPVVKLVCQKTGTIWLLAEVDPENPDIAIGLRQDFRRAPRIVRICLSRLSSTQDALQDVECDPRFRPSKTLQQYAQDARARWRSQSKAPRRVSQLGCRSKR